MSELNWQKIEEIFPLVADLPAEEREARLADLCGDDENLRREIAALIKADERAAASFGEAAAAFSPDFLSAVYSGASEAPTVSQVGETIGAYRIERKIGEGGMGAVYLARRSDGAFDKKAAVKIIRKGLDTEFNLRRFRRERQVLAALEHPNIARLLDGGTNSEGLPYFLLEYVEGRQLFDFCRSVKPDMPARLGLFRQICSAVAYAHEKQVIHRDLKPGNILVADKGSAVKLLDFGIAKILDAELAGGEPLADTATFMRQMTPEYASPEQIKGEPVSPASDIYSLGVILYELVTGERPYKFASRAPHEIARVICEEDPRPPLTDFEGAPVPDDLRYIILKSLRKKALARYPSVDELDCDIERFLSGSPVLSEEARLEFFEKTAAADRVSGNVSLAVAPFQILGARRAPETQGESDPESDFLSVGLLDGLTTRLSGVRNLSVRPTSSVLRAASMAKDALALGRHLDADYVLEGHILRRGEQIRVSVQLFKTKDNHILWAEHFDEREADAFLLQDSISERVAGALLSLRVSPATDGFVAPATGRISVLESFSGARQWAYLPPALLLFLAFAGFGAYLSSRPAGAPAENPPVAAAERPAEKRNRAKAPRTTDEVADSLYLAGKRELEPRSLEGFKKAIEFFSEAVKRDPDFALAYSGLADAHILLASSQGKAEEYRKAEEYAVRALALEPDLAEARVSLGMARFRSAGDFAQAEKHFLRAIELDPASATAHHWYSIILSEIGKTDDALREIETAARLAPDSAVIQLSLAQMYLQIKRYDESIDYFDRAIKINAGFTAVYYWKSLVQQFQGKYDQALETYRKARIYSRQDEREPLWLLMRAHERADAGKAVEALKIMELYFQGEQFRKNPARYAAEIALVYNLLGDDEKAFSWLGKIECETDKDAEFHAGDPRFANLHPDARFAALKRRWQEKA